MNRFTFVFASLLTFSVLLFSPYKVQAEADYEAIINNVDMTAIQQHVQFFSGLTTRGTGYPGNLEAAQYIRNKFEEYGLVNVSYQESPVTASIDHGANITLLTDSPQTFTIYPVEPNLVCPSTTPPEGITGSLVYVGAGYYEDLEGRELNGSIVLMDWNSERRWLTAAQLGAKAVIFLPPLRVFHSPYWFKEKTVDVPLNFPRFYVPNPAASLLRNEAGRAYVKIVANTYWEKVTGLNVYGFVEGTQHSSLVILSSYYDSGSITPSLAPGAQEACGVSTLLELAKYFNQHRPPYSIMFVAYGGHHQALAGADKVMHSMLSLNYHPDLKMREIARKFRIAINLDFSTGSNIFYEIQYGHFYWGGAYGSWSGGNVWGTGPHYQLFPLRLKSIAEDVNRQKPGGKTYEMIFQIPPQKQGTTIISEYLTPYPWTKRFYDSEPLMASGMQSLTFTTAYDSRPYFNSPFDTLANVNFENLRPQVELTYILANSLLHMEDLNQRTLEGGIDFVEGAGGGNYLSYSGVVAVWDEQKAWYKSVPNALVVAWDWETMQEWPVASPNWRKFQLTGEDGYFQFWGYDIGSRASFSAWIVDKSTGNVISAPDQGLHSFRKEFEIHHLRGAGAATAMVDVTPVGFLTVFNCSTIGVFNVYSPTALAVPRAEETGAAIPPVLSVLEAETNTPSTSYSSWSTSVGGYSLTIFAIEPEVPTRIMIKLTAARYPLMLLFNCTQEDLYGSGYTLPWGEQLLLTHSSLRYAEDLHHLNTMRFETVSKFQPQILQSREYEQHQQVRLLIDQAQTALKNHKYAEYLEKSTRAWIMAKDVYYFIRPIIEDSAFAIPLFAAILIPFTFLAENLLFSYHGKKRALSFCLVSALFLVVLGLIHPGIQLAASPIMIFIGFSILILVSPILLLTFGRLSAYIHSLRVTYLGPHEERLSRLDVSIYSFLTGLENMKRRKLRSALTLISVVFMVLALTSITSLSTLSILRATPTPGAELYEGVYIRRMKWGYGQYALGTEIPEALSQMFPNATVAPRAWRYTAFPSQILPMDERLGFRATFKGNVAVAPVLWGLTPQETEVYPAEVFLQMGRWFLPDESFACILPAQVAEWLNATVGDKITLENMKYTVVGIISEKLGMLEEIDGEQITPIQFDVIQTPNPWDIHTPLDYCIILPYCQVMAMGGSVASVSIKFMDVSQVSSAAAKVYSSLRDLIVYARYGQTTWSYAKGTGFQVWGLQYQIIPLVIAVISVLNITLGIVYERQREISIYGTLGLSPLHVMIVFLAENIVYAIVGGLMGYTLSMITTNILTNFLPEVVFNFSSSIVMSSLGISMIAIMVSSGYPLFVASRLVTPSLKRVWEIPTKPIMDMWEIPMPFYASSAEEIHNILAYIQEYISAHQVSQAEDFSVENLRLTEGEMGGRLYKGFQMTTRLYPYEQGVAQDTQINAVQLDKTRWQFYFFLKKTGGSLDDWEKLNRNFLGLFRQQLLLWRSLPPEEKERYTDMPKQIQTGVNHQT